MDNYHDNNDNTLSRLFDTGISSTWRATILPDTSLSVNPIPCTISNIFNMINNVMEYKMTVTTDTNYSFTVSGHGFIIDNIFESRTSSQNLVIKSKCRSLHYYDLKNNVQISGNYIS
jgi:hypothetical protein